MVFAAICFLCWPGCVYTSKSISLDEPTDRIVAAKGATLGCLRRDVSDYARQTELGGVLGGVLGRLWTW